jgi:hypothetical protein
MVGSNEGIDRGQSTLFRNGWRTGSARIIWSGSSLCSSNSWTCPSWDVSALRSAAPKIQLVGETFRAGKVRQRIAQAPVLGEDIHARYSEGFSQKSHDARPVDGVTASVKIDGHEATRRKGVEADVALGDHHEAGEPPGSLRLFGPTSTTCAGAIGCMPSNAGRVSRRPVSRSRSRRRAGSAL